MKEKCFRINLCLFQSNLLRDKVMEWNICHWELDIKSLFVIANVLTKLLNLISYLCMTQTGRTGGVLKTHFDPLVSFIVMQ